MSRSIIPQSDQSHIESAYASGLSPGDMVAIFGGKYKRTTIKAHLKRRGLLRSQSAAAVLAARNGKKTQAILALHRVCTTTNRFNPSKTPWIGHPERHPHWKPDRMSAGRGRSITEERHFIASVLCERGYQCEITGQGGQLSVHHIDGVWSHPERRYERDNVIVILRSIHKHFHRMYGWKATRAQWNAYLAKEEYNVALS